VLALAQRSLKRMLAYSSVAHAGYLLVASLYGKSAGTAAFIVYLGGLHADDRRAFAVHGREGTAREKSDV